MTCYIYLIWLKATLKASGSPAQPPALQACVCFCAALMRTKWSHNKRGGGLSVWGHSDERSLLINFRVTTLGLVKVYFLACNLLAYNLSTPDPFSTVQTADISAHVIIRPGKQWWKRDLTRQQRSSHQSNALWESTKQKQTEIWRWSRSYNSSICLQMWTNPTWQFWNDTYELVFMNEYHGMLCTR